MPELKWSRLFETGTKEIDDQHRRIVDYINRVGALPSGLSTARLQETLDDVIDYTLYHFAFEECLLEDAGDSHLEAHKRVHARFAADLQTLRSRFAAGELEGGELREILMRWLFDHIRGIDNTTLKTGTL